MLKVEMQVTLQLIDCLAGRAGGTTLLVLSYLQEQGHGDDGKKDV